MRGARWKNTRVLADRDAAERGEVQEREGSDRVKRVESGAVEGRVDSGREGRVDARGWRGARVAAGRSAAERGAEEEREGCGRGERAE